MRLGQNLLVLIKKKRVAVVEGSCSRRRKNLLLAELIGLLVK